MIVRVDWFPRTDDMGNIGPKSYHVWQCTEYFVEQMAATKARLMLDCCKHDIAISDGDTAYIMNDDGKTIDTIRT